MHLAAGNQSLAAEAHAWLLAHWQHEAAWASAAFYWPGHDSMGWAAATLLLSRRSWPGGAHAAISAFASSDARHRQALSLMWRGWLLGRVGCGAAEVWPLLL